MAKVIEVQFTDKGPVALCPDCGCTEWLILLDGFGDVWKNVIGTACSNCQFVVDWISAGKAEEND
jgi:hypothetical protein